MFSGISPFDIIGGVGTILGAVQGEIAGQRAFEDWTRRTNDSLQRVDAGRDQSQDYLALLQKNMWGDGTYGYSALPGYMEAGSTGINQGIEGGYASLLNNYGNMGAGVQGRYDNMAKNLSGQYGDLEKKMNDAYTARTNKAMGMLEGAGNQAKADIRQDYKNLGSAQQTGLVNRGLGNTIMGGSLAAGNERQQQSALGRLGESLRKESLSTYGQFSGDQLASQSGLAQQGIGFNKDLGTGGAALALDIGRGATDLAQQRLTAVSDSQRMGLDATYGARADALSNQERLGSMNLDQIRQWTDRYIGTNLDWGQPAEVVPAASAIGQWAAGQAAARSSAPSSKKQKGGGGGGAFGFSLNASCIGADSEVLTPFGPKEIGDIEPGDAVLGEDNQFHEVVAKDCGFDYEGDKADLFEIICGDAGICATGNHMIEGVPAEHWCVDDRITFNGDIDRVTKVNRVPYREVADIMLAGNVHYIANGFVIHSVIGAQGVDQYRKHLAEFGTEQDGYLRFNKNPEGCWVKG